MITSSQRAMEDQALFSITQQERDNLVITKKAKLEALHVEIRAEEQAAGSGVEVKKLHIRHEEELVELHRRHREELEEGRIAHSMRLSDVIEKHCRRKSDLDRWALDEENKIDEQFERKKAELKQKRDVEDAKVKDDLFKALMERANLSSNASPASSQAPTNTSRFTTHSSTDKRRYDGSESASPLGAPLLLGSGVNGNDLSPAQSKRPKVNLFFRRESIVAESSAPNPSTMACLLPPRRSSRTENREQKPTSKRPTKPARPQSQLSPLTPTRKVTNPSISTSASTHSPSNTVSNTSTMLSPQTSFKFFTSGSRRQIKGPLSGDNQTSKPSICN
jgi:hypothetical protein